MMKLCGGTQAKVCSWNSTQ